MRYKTRTKTAVRERQGGISVSKEVFVELRRNLLQSLQPRKNAILVVFCGDTNPALVTRLKEKYEIAGKAVVFGPGMGVVLKGDVGKASKS